MTTGSSDVTAPSGIEQDTQDEAVCLTARVASDGARFIATVDGIELEGIGNTADAARESLVQAMRSWLERMDTTGKLGETLGLEALAEETEILLQFVDSEDSDRDSD